MLSTSFRKSFWLGALHRRIKFSNFFMIKCKTTHAQNVLFQHWVLINQIFSLVPIVKRNANYAEICTVGNLEADFQQVPLIQFF